MGHEWPWSLLGWRHWRTGGAGAIEFIQGGEVGGGEGRIDRRWRSDGAVRVCVDCGGGFARDHLNLGRRALGVRGVEAGL